MTFEARSITRGRKQLSKNAPHTRTEKLPNIANQSYDVSIGAPSPANRYTATQGMSESTTLATRVFVDSRPFVIFMYSSPPKNIATTINPAHAHASPKTIKQINNGNKTTDVATRTNKFERFFGSFSAASTFFVSSICFPIVPKVSIETLCASTSYKTAHVLRFLKRLLRRLRARYDATFSRRQFQDRVYHIGHID